MARYLSLGLVITLDWIKLHFTQNQGFNIEKIEKKQSIYFKKVVSVKEEEKILHNSFIKKEFKKNFF